MDRQRTNSRILTVLLLAVALLPIAYLVGYFVLCSVERGSGGDKFINRSYHSKAECVLYWPLAMAEAKIRRAPVMLWYPAPDNAFPYQPYVSMKDYDEYRGFGAD